MRIKEKIKRLKEELEKAKAKLEQLNFFTTWLKGQIKLLEIEQLLKSVEEKEMEKKKKI